MWGEIKGIDHTRGSLDRINLVLKQLPDIDLPTQPGIKKLRVTASMLGKHNYSRYEVEDKVGIDLAERLGLTYIDHKSQESQNILWCRFHIFADRALLDFRTRSAPSHRRCWRTEALTGAIHPPIAAAMILLADLHNNQCIVDPFAGSGTILIEAGLHNSDLNLVGCDISDQSIASAKQHSNLAGVPLTLIQSDASVAKLPMADRIISNPPWGIMVKEQGKLNQTNFIKTIFQNLNDHGRAVLLTDMAIDLPAMLHQQGLKPLLVEKLRVAGRLTHLTVVGSQPIFPDTVVGQSLENAWSKYRVTE